MSKQREHRVSIRLDAAMWKWVKETAAGNDRDASWVIRSCIRDAQAIDRGEIRFGVRPDAARKAGL